MNRVTTHARWWWGAVMALLVGLAAGGAAGSWAVRNGLPVVGAGMAPHATSSTADNGVQPFPDSFAPLLKPALPAVVNISSSKVVKTRNVPNVPFFNDPFFRQFFGDQLPNAPRERREQSLGSGVIVDPNGLILTNNHVVQGATDVKVYLSERREFKAHIVGTDPKTDVAVVKIDAKGLPTLPFGDSSKTQVGDIVFAIGDPFGVGETVTMGIVSATGRGGLGIEDYEDFIQTDAAINPGNSGGALINTRGEVIGISTAIISGSGGNNGVGFAIPVNMARNVMDQIQKHGKVVRGYLGIWIQPVTPEIAKAFGLNESRGALVGDVAPDGPAAKAGLAKGDIILKLNGQAVSDARNLTLQISQTAPGTTVRLAVFHNGKEHEVSVTLGQLPEKTERAGGGGQAEEGALEGVRVQDLTPQIAQELGLPANTFGVVVVEVAPGSLVASAGLQRGDVIQEVNRKRVSNVGEYERAVREAANQPVLLLINRGGTTSYLVVSSQ